jgi:hypothetical protein
MSFGSSGLVDWRRFAGLLRINTGELVETERLGKLVTGRRRLSKVLYKMYGNM